MIAMGFPIVMFDRWVSPSTRAAPLVFWQFFPRTAAPPTRMGAVVKMDGSNTCLARSNADKPSPHRTLNLRPMSSAFSKKKYWVWKLARKKAQKIWPLVCVFWFECMWVTSQKKISSFTPWSHTNIWPMHGLRLGIYHQRSALGYFRLMSWDSSVSSVSSDLWDWSWDLNVGHSTQARGPSCAMLLGALQTWWEVFQNVTLERCWTMKGSRAWQFAPAVPKHRWSNQRSGLNWSENLQDCGVMSQDYVKWILSETIFGGTQ